MFRGELSCWGWNPCLLGGLLSTLGGAEPQKQRYAVMLFSPLTDHRHALHPRARWIPIHLPGARSNPGSALTDRQSHTFHRRHPRPA